MPIRKIKANILQLFEDTKSLILDSDALAGASTITVKNIEDVAVNNILFFRYPGNEGSEIIATHAATAPSGTTVTLASTLVRTHPAGTKVYVIRANQVRFYHSATKDDANVSDAGLTALAAAQNINPTMADNIYEDTVQTSGFYYYRFIDSINSINLLYSDPIPWNQFEPQFVDNEVGFILEFVRKKIDHDWDERFSKQTAIQEINNCLTYIQKKLKRFSRYLVPDYSIGNTSRGVYDYALPTDIYDNETNKSILQARIGTALDYLTPLDEKEFDAQMQQVAHTKVRTQAVVGAVTLAIDNSYDFDDSGTIKIYTSDVPDVITYTGVTRSLTSGVLTGIPASGDGSIEDTHIVGKDVWQNEREGLPKYFNVRNGRIRIWPLADSSWINKNLFLDYYQEVTKVDSEADTLDTLRYDMVLYWLLWQAKAYWRNNGVADLKDADFLLFQDTLKSAIRTETSGQKFKMKPKLNTINYNTRPKGKFENT